MESMQTLQKLIDAEKEAAALYAAAESFGAGLDGRIDSRRAALGEELRAQTRSAVAAAEEAASKEADAAIASAGQDTEARIAALKTAFESKKPDYVETLFRLATGDGDGQS